jgi:hypothetical protein
LPDQCNHNQLGILESDLNQYEASMGHLVGPEVARLLRIENNRAQIIHFYAAFQKPLSEV